VEFEKKAAMVSLH